MNYNYNFNWHSVSGGAPFVTFSTLGIAFNSVSISKLGTPEKVMVGFDEDNLVIGVKKYEDEPQIKPYEFASRIKNGWIRIGCKDFIRYLQKVSGLNFSEAKKIMANFDADSETLIIEMKDAYTK
jgi:hypothetical protein